MVTNAPNLANTQLQQSVAHLRGVGSKLKQVLEKAGIKQIVDLLFHLPTRYLDKTRIVNIGELRAYQYAVIQCSISSSNVMFGKRRSLMVKVKDDSGSITLRFFYFNQAIQRQFEKGKWLRCYGEVRPGQTGLELFHPEYEPVNPDSPLPAPELTPIYPASDGLTQLRLRNLCQQALELLKDSELDDSLFDYCQQMSLAQVTSPKLKRARQILTQGSLKKMLQYLHNPPVDVAINDLLLGQHPYQQRIALEELCAHQMSLQIARAQSKTQQTHILKDQNQTQQRFFQGLRFGLTGAQQKVITEIKDDVLSGQPMLRLLQGDVGSGKTVVACAAVLFALSSNKQALIMAPTEILAEQHRANFTQWLEPLGFNIAYLSRKTKGKGRITVLEQITTGKAQLVIGTHALFQDDIHFDDLAMIVIDEQHRFGVNQRLSLSNKGMQSANSESRIQPHQLIMTATPIPRTLAMSHYSDLDTSIIDELPPGRTPVETIAVTEARRSEIIDKIRQACANDRQVYWVCTLVEESENLQAQAAEAAAVELDLLLPEFNVGLIHGRLKPKEKNQIMQRFKSGDIHLLVATTVIEVGVDVPNASLMVIENPERLGLSQLHQLRGRVGRGSAKSHCVLMYKPPLSNASKERVNAMRNTNDGFEIAEIDLKLRGPGELLGAKQAGSVEFLLADLQRDSSLVPIARELAVHLLPQQQICNDLLNRWMGGTIQYLKA